VDGDFIASHNYEEAMKSPSMKGRFIYESQEIEMLQIVARCRKERAVDHEELA